MYLNPRPRPTAKAESVLHRRKRCASPKSNAESLVFGYPPFFFFFFQATVAPRLRQSNKQSESIMDEAFSVALLCSAVVEHWGGTFLQATTALLFIQRGMSMQQPRSLSALQFEFSSDPRSSYQCVYSFWSGSAVLVVCFVLKGLNPRGFHRAWSKSLVAPPWFFSRVLWVYAVLVIHNP